MIVYGVPEGYEAPEFDWKEPYDAYLKACEANANGIRYWLTKSGYTGKYSGKIVNFPVADGYARYMFANAPRGSTHKVKSFLMLLEYSDAWEYRDVEFLPKKEIIHRIEQQEAMAKLFNTPQTIEG